MKTSVTLQFGIWVLITLGIASCSKTPQQTHFPERVFHSSWSMPAEELNRLIVNVTAIRPDDDLRKVVEIVGVPDRDYTVQKNRKIRHFTYYVVRHDPNSPNEFDKVVLIAFDDGNKVIGIYSNVDGIASRNWPGAQDSTRSAGR